MELERTYTAFAGTERIASGDLRTVLLRTKERQDHEESASILLFEDQSGQQIDFDLRGTADEVLARLPSHPLFAKEAQAKVGPGRPKLGVVSREVSLLPRHWDWLTKQPGGISVTLRRLVEEARKRQGPTNISKEAVGKFMWAMAGNFPNFEEASRAFYAKDQAHFESLIQGWPEQIRLHIIHLAKESGCFL